MIRATSLAIAASAFLLSNPAMAASKGVFKCSNGNIKYQTEFKNCICEFTEKTGKVSLAGFEQNGKSCDKICADGLKTAGCGGDSI